ncbi:hypothetical protein D5086_013761 [Populus alba]|uniref:Uncharacterized protein n=2 Tax=Populus TaxID=3689 RepID=A0ACC4C5W4_POPAL|nr:hypothetical protein POTOM_024080 [Populus tomentosa]
MLRLERRRNAVPFQLCTREVGHRMAPRALMKAVDELATLNEPPGGLAFDKTSVDSKSLTSKQELKSILLTN